MSTEKSFQSEYRIQVQQEHLRSIKDPFNEGITIMHALVKVRNLPNGQIPDKINPRSHETLKMTARIPEAIEDSIKDNPKVFHLLNRGCLILAEKAWYNNQTKTLHFSIKSEDEYGMVDGATTDRVLNLIKQNISNADFSTLCEEEIPEYLKDSYVHIEIIAGEIDQDLRIKLADARNTSEQVKEFSLEDLGGKFDWLKNILEKSEFKSKIRYRENEPKPVDIRTILALLTLFHERWNDLKRDPVIAYTGKGAVLENYKEKDWLEGYKQLEPVVLDILRLYDHIHVNFQKAYQKAFKEAQGDERARVKLGKKKEVHFIEKAKNAKTLPLTGGKTQYVLTDGWLYPLLASFRMLLIWPKTIRGDVKWACDPFIFFEEEGQDLVFFLVERSEELGRNPNATGKSKGVWSGLREKVENKMLRRKLQVLNDK